MLSPLPGMTSPFHLHFSFSTTALLVYAYSFFKIYFSYLPYEDLALHSWLGFHFLFCTIIVISIVLHYDSYHHCTAVVYFYGLYQILSC